MYSGKRSLFERQSSRLVFAIDCYYDGVRFDLPAFHPYHPRFERYHRSVALCHDFALNNGI